jgi:hypothetical protein
LRKARGADAVVKQKKYLGDGVYAEFDGYFVALTTENGVSITNTIYLEPDVYGNLCEFMNRLQDKEEDNADEHQGS